MSCSLRTILYVRVTIVVAAYIPLFVPRYTVRCAARWPLIAGVERRGAAAAGASGGAVPKATPERTSAHRARLRSTSAPGRSVSESSGGDTDERDGAHEKRDVASWSSV
eukprot:6180673-Pleurochrysis_carterae.AAC.1